MGSSFQVVGRAARFHRARIDKAYDWWLSFCVYNDFGRSKNLVTPYNLHEYQQLCQTCTNSTQNAIFKTKTIGRKRMQQRVSEGTHLNPASWQVKRSVEKQRIAYWEEALLSATPPRYEQLKLLSFSKTNCKRTGNFVKHWLNMWYTQLIEWNKQLALFWIHQNVVAALWVSNVFIARICG